MGLISDPMGNKFINGEPPQRIVSLCPPITELLFDIGLKGRVVGVSSQCRFPEVRVREIKSMGAVRRPDIKAIMDAAPDFVVLDTRETDDAVVTLLKEEFSVWDSSPRTVLEAIVEIKSLGKLMDKEANANWIAGKVETRFAEFQASFEKPVEPINAVLLAGYKPWSAIGGETIATELLSYIGVDNLWGSQKGIFSIEAKKIPGGPSTRLLLAGGPHHFHKRHIPVVMRKYPDRNVILVREDLLTWHGSRLLRTPEYLSNLFLELQP